MSVGAHRTVAVATLESKRTCCPRLHEAVELVGKRWTGAIVAVLLEAIAVAALESFGAMVDVAGEVPVDGSSEASRQLRAVA